MYLQGNWLAQWQPAVAAAVAPDPALLRRQMMAKRRDELLDDALKGTFPASDPVSAVRIS